MCSFLWTFCWILLDYGSISSAFEWHWEFCFQNAIDESLLFPGPKLVACMPCFQRSKDDAGFWYVSLCLNIGATASNLLLEKSHDHLMVSTISSGLIKKKKKIHYMIWFITIVHFRPDGNYGHIMPMQKTNLWHSCKKKF